MSLFYIGHPKETDLALFAGGESGPLTRWRIERHLQSCEACQTDVADFFHLQDDLEELAHLPSSIDWDAMSLRIREAVAEAGEVEPEPAPGFFQKPLAWQLGLATAAVFCGFIVIQQYPMPVAEEQVMTASNEQNAGLSTARSLEDAEMPVAVGGSLASTESLNEIQSADLKQKSQSFSDLDALASTPAQERAQSVGAEKKNFDLAVRTEEELPGDRFRNLAPPPAAEPESEPARLASDLRANKNARVGGGRDALYGARKRVANAPAPAAPVRQVEAEGQLKARRKDDAVMTIAMADIVTGPASLREEFDQPVGEKKEVSADEVQLAKAGVAPAEQRMTRAEGQSAEIGAQQFGASFAAQPGGLGTSITPTANGSEVVVDVKTDGGVRFRTMDAATGRITITDVYAQ